MNFLKQQLPTILLAVSVGMLLAHTIHVQGFVHDTKVDGFCETGAHIKDAEPNGGKRLAVQINGDWYVWLDCLDTVDD